MYRLQFFLPVLPSQYPPLGRSATTTPSTSCSNATLSAPHTSSAPSSFNIQPWSVILVRDAGDRERLSTAMLGGNAKKVLSAPVTAVFCADLGERRCCCARCRFPCREKLLLHMYLIVMDVQSIADLASGTLSCTHLYEQATMCFSHTCIHRTI